MKNKYFLIALCFIILVFLFLCAINPFVRVNPYNKNPLCALVYYFTFKPAKIELIVKGRDGAEDIRHVFPNYSRYHKIPVLGLYAKRKNKVVLVEHYENGKEKIKNITIKTRKKHANTYATVLKKNDKKTWYHYLANGTVYDENGVLRFNFIDENECIYYFKNEIVSENRIKGLVRYSLLGKKIKQYAYPSNFTSYSHSIGQKPNGNFLVIGSFADEKVSIDGKDVPSHNDIAIEIDFNTGNVVNKIDLAEILNPQRDVIASKTEMKKYGLHDWCHINGIDYDTSDKSVVISCRHSGVVKIDEKTNKLIWIISPNKGFEKSGRDGKGPAISDKVLIATNSKGIPYKKDIQQGAYSESFKWPIMNHNIKVYPNNIITVYDNSGPIHNKKVFSTDMSVASIYKIDEKKKTIKQIWKKDMETYSDNGSNVLYYPDKNEVVVYSSSVYNYMNGTMCGKLERYDFNTQKVLFSAFINRHSPYYVYRTDDFKFYPEE